jgi:hypothetical protein
MNVISHERPGVTENARLLTQASETIPEILTIGRILKNWTSLDSTRDDMMK